MDSRTVRTLNNLIRIEVDTLHAYAKSQEQIRDADIARDLEWFRLDYERHVGKLIAAVERVGGNPVTPRRDAKGFIIQGMTALRSATGLDGALKAMRTSEKRTNDEYDEALLVPLPDDVMALLFSNRADARRHLTYLEEALDRRRHEVLQSRTQPIV